MERFTKRDKYGYSHIKGDIYEGHDFNGISVYVKAIDKLCLIEDIEDELGCDLITLFKALKEGFYVKKDSINEGFISLVKAKDIREVDMITKSITFCDYEFVYFKDYGKTWALTKEELEEE